MIQISYYGAPAAIGTLEETSNAGYGLSTRYLAISDSSSSDGEYDNF
jgi:hypothetical protein